MSQIANLPNHIGLILDGNRRWAKARGLPATQGHFKGYKNFYKVSRYLLVDKHVPYVSAFVFSTENWQRTKTEVGYLMKLVERALKEYLAECVKDNLRIKVLGGRDKLSQPVLRAIDEAESQTAHNTNGTLGLCFNYGGQQEIVDAVGQLVGSGQTTVTAESISQFIYHPEIPPLDLIIRTSGEQRLSGFMLWRSAYAELYFTDKHWPEFSTAEADAALAEFAHRQRRYGS